MILFKIKKGELVALFGETGKGKSTFLDVFGISQKVYR